METTEREESGIIIREHWVNGVVVGKEEFPISIIIPIQPIQPTNQELSDNQLILMDVLATMYEDMLAKGTV